MKVPPNTATKIPLNPDTLDRAILESPGQRKFDSSIWKSTVPLRRYMLMDLLRSGVFSKTQAEVIELLGPPIRTGTEWGRPVAFYDFGTYESENIVLEVSFAENKPFFFVIGQHSEDGYFDINSTDWHWKNHDPASAAKEMNKMLFVVGAPKQHLCQFVGHPKQEGSAWKCGPVEVEFTPDNLKVKRFRLTPDRFDIVKTTTDWEDKDLRVVPGSYTTAFDFLDLDAKPGAYFVRPFGKFDRVRWQTLGWRSGMVFDIAHHYALIGKSRQEVRGLLGEPFFSESKVSQRERTAYINQRKTDKEPFNRFDWFQLGGQGCMSVDPGLYLEVVYQGNLLMGEKAVAYRMVKSNYDNDGKIEIFGNMLSERQGYCLPVPNTGAKAH
ncbi:MAG: hypothetical protein C0507_23025 [Cyanobacteria bacterium PR.3.49]|nr:hypothetical protein [Cyanobacteria bacterium PR.3.49]